MSRVGRLWLCSSLYKRCFERLTQLGRKRNRAKSEFQLVILQQWKDQKSESHTTQDGAEYFSGVAETLQWIQKKFDINPVITTRDSKTKPANDLSCRSAQG